MLFFFFFFFQAEDGIRDFHVTGVQTCALPISSVTVAVTVAVAAVGATGCASVAVTVDVAITVAVAVAVARSEERRVGKECRFRRGAHYLKKKKLTHQDNELLEDKEDEYYW